MCIALGASPEQSADNLLRWLDAVATNLNLGGSFIYDAKGDRVQGAYHQLSVQEETRYRQTLQYKLNALGVEAASKGQSCGTILEIGGGRGAGKGAVHMAAIPIGPFLG